MRRNAGYSFYVLIMIVVLAAVGVGWHFVEKDIVNKYVEESGGVIMTEDEIEELKEEAYKEGYDEGVNEGYENGYADGEAGVNNSITFATVYYTDNGDCYHVNPKCTSIRYNNNIHEAALDQLRGSGLRPCDICVPHD